MMMRILLVATIFAIGGLGTIQGQTPGALAGSDAAGTSSMSTGEKYETPTVYDPSRDAAVDIKLAIAEAGRTNKRILVEVGGEWCKWCHYLDDFFAAHPDLVTLRDANFVLVKVNYSIATEKNPVGNENKEVLSRYPAVPGYPHIFVLDKDGSLLHSQDTGVLEDGKASYLLDKFTAFLTQWAPKRS